MGEASRVGDDLMRRCNQGKRFCHAGGELYRSQELFCPASWQPISGNPSSRIVPPQNPGTLGDLKVARSLARPGPKKSSRHLFWAGRPGGTAGGTHGSRLPRAM